MTEAEQIMKRCQAGTRNYEEANNLHAACYGIIGKLLAQPEQEPVAWRAPNWSNLHGEYGYRDFNDPVIDISTGKPSPYNEPLYTHPQRTWIGLTDVEIDYLLGSTVGENEETHISFARAIEAKLKELNDHSI